MALVHGIIINKAPHMEVCSNHARLAQTPSVLRNRSQALNILPDGVCRIELSRGKFALVDERDFDFLSQWIWSFYNSGYAMRNLQWSEGGKRKAKTILMHRLIMEHHGHSMEGLDVDHVNRDKLDNRYSNLRVATRSENTANGPRRSHNTSGVTGVVYHKKMEKWQAYITINYKRTHLGTFATKEEAIAVRKQTLIDCYGVHANLSDDLSQCLRIPGGEI